MGVLSRGIVAGAIVLVAASVTACAKPSLSPSGGSPGGFESTPTLDEDTGSTLPIDAVGRGCPVQISRNGFSALQEMSGEPVAAALAHYPDLSTFSSLVDQNKIADYLDYSLPAATLFAPNNAAFERMRTQLGPETYNRLTTNKADFTRFVKSLLVMEFDSQKVLANAAEVRTLAGTEFRVDRNGPTISIKGPGGQADVTCGDIPTQNAMVHVVNNVPVRLPSSTDNGQQS